MRRRTDCIFVALALVLIAAGCTPPGPRALLDGEQLLKRGKYGQAIVKFQTATRLLPSNGQAWNHLGLAYHKAGQLNAALEAYQQARRCDVNLTPVRFNLGCLMLEQDNVQGAVGELTAYTLLQNESAEGWLKLGTAQLRLRQYDSAERSYETALHLRPDLAEAWNGLGVIYTQRKHPKDALNCFNTALQKQPRYSPAMLNCAVVYQQNFNNHSAALQKYRDYLRLNPTGPEANDVHQLVRQLEAEQAPPPVAPAAPASEVAVVSEPPPSTPVTPPAHVRTNVAITQPSAPAPASNPPSHTRPERTVARNVTNEPNLSFRSRGGLGSQNVGTESLANTHLQEPTRKKEPAVRTEKPQLVAENSGSGRAATTTSIPAEPPPKATAPEPTTKATVSEPPANPTVMEPPVAQPTTPEPPAQVEVVQVPDERAPKLPQDLGTPPASTTPSTPSTPVTPSSSSNQIDQASALLAQKLSQPPPQQPIEEEKPSALDRLNPATWFHGKKRTATDEPPVEPLPAIKTEMPSDNTGPKLSSVRPRQTPPPVALKRYAYRNPSKPAVGNRAKAEPLFSEAVDAQRAGRLSDAIDGYRKAIKQDPSFFQAQYNLGLAEYDMKDVPRSLSAYETALSINPTSVNARYNFALALEMGSYYHDAANELEKLLEEKPSETRAHFTVASLYADKLGQPALARAHYRKVLELDPQHPQATAIRFWLAANP